MEFSRSYTVIVQAIGIIFIYRLLRVFLRATPCNSVVNKLLLISNSLNPEQLLSSCWNSCQLLQ
jgi:hypothetical protein